ncbi:MAG: hypothetical protein E7055_22135 [Lentisphaerae bacterium]|nr:hypothetical protein [Lentisphaerota bacterium]
MKKLRSLGVVFLHFLPFWIFGLALLLPFVCVGIEFCISCFGNKKLLCDFQDFTAGIAGNGVFVALLLTSWLLSLIWSFLIHWFWKKEEREPRWVMSAVFFFFPLISSLLISCLPGTIWPNLSVEKRRRVACHINLRNIYSALYMYAANNDGHYPDRLEALSPDYLTDDKVLRCPACREHSGFSDYNYFGKGKKETGPVFIILEDKVDNHRGNFKNRLDSECRGIPGKKYE